MKNIIDTTLAPKAIGTYSQGVVIGDLILFSGQIGLDPETMTMEDHFEGQANQILKNIDGLLESQGLTRENIVKTTIFLKSLNDFEKLNNLYVDYFKAPYPARSCVEVSRLPKDALVEIEVIAQKNV
ncbi:MAG: RidA family protein [Bacteriovoracaceae bacterium]